MCDGTVITSDMGAASRRQAAYTTRGQHTGGESRRRKAVDKVGDALREVQQVLALFQPPESDLRPNAAAAGPQICAGPP